MDSEKPSPLKNFSLYVGIVVLAVLILAVFGSYRLYQSRINPKASPIPIPSPTGFQTLISPTPAPSPVLGTNTPNTQPQAGPEDQHVQNVGITVNSPASGSQISKSVIVSGYANVLGARVRILIYDSEGNLLGQVQTLACEGSQACPFEAELNFTHPKTKTGQIEVFSPTPVEPKAYLQTIPVQF